MAHQGITDEHVRLCGDSLVELIAKDNSRITYCPPSVEFLDASGSCGIADLSNCTRLRVLRAAGNKRITKCPPSVEDLDASGSYGITDLRDYTRLRRLDAHFNNGITWCPPTVEDLNIGQQRGFTNETVLACSRLTTLNITGNMNIREVPDTVVKLVCNSYCYASNLKNCTQLRELSIRGCGGPELLLPRPLRSSTQLAA